MQARARRVILSPCNSEAVVPLWSHRSLRTVRLTKTHSAIWSHGRSNRASISWFPAAPRERLRHSLTTSGCASSTSPSKSSPDACRSSPAQLPIQRRRLSPKQKKWRRGPGVNAILTASPYYNKPTQEGQYRHFRAIAEAVDKPVILYNVPGRTSANLEPATLARLSEVPNIAGVKEASGNMTQIAEVLNSVPETFLVLSGDDAVTLPVIALGGVGVISVASNEIPREMAEMTRAALNNDWHTARTLHRKYLPLMQANFIESSPLPVKAVLAMMGKIEEIYRLPLLPMRRDTRSKLQKIATDAGLIARPAAPPRCRRILCLRKLGGGPAQSDSAPRLLRTVQFRQRTPRRPRSQSFALARAIQQSGGSPRGHATRCPAC